MKKYILKECTASCYWKDRNQLQVGYAVFNDEEPSEIKMFVDKNQALQELNNYYTLVEYYAVKPYSYYNVTEYCIETREYNNDGEFVGGTVDYCITNFPKYVDIINY